MKLIFMAIFWGLSLWGKEEINHYNKLSNHYGFNWLDPQNAKCEIINKNKIEEFKKAKINCEEKKEGESFSQKSGPWFSCRISKEKEYFLYKTITVCENQLAIMNANGP